MQLKTFIEELKTIDDWGVQKFFNPEDGGGCPCFNGTKIIDDEVLKVWGRCWRVSDNLQDLHIAGTLEEKDLQKIAKIIKRKLDRQKWYNPYTIIYDSMKFMEKNGI